MKKHVSMSLMLMGLLLLASCGSGNAKKETHCGAQCEAAPSLRLESYSYNEIGEFEDAESADGGNKYVLFKGGGVLPMADGQKGITQLRDSLLKLAEVRFDDSDEPEPVMIGGVKKATDAPAGVEPGSEVLSNLTVALVNPQVAVFRQESYRYQDGAAHGNTAVSFVNYSLNDGKILSLSDIVVPGKENVLQKAIVASLKSDKVNILVKESEVPVSSQFEITTEGLAFSYNPYEIAPYSEGVVSVCLNASDLQKQGVLTPAGAKLFSLPESK